MLGLGQGNIEHLTEHITRINRMSDQIGDALRPQCAIGQLAGEVRLALKEALHLGLCCETTRSIAFERFLQDGGGRLVSDEHIAMLVGHFEAIAHRCLVRPQPAFKPCPFAIAGGLGILLAEVLRPECLNAFDVVTIRVSNGFEGGGGTIEQRSGFLDSIAKIEVNAIITGKAADIIDDDHIARPSFRLVQEGEHVLNSGAIQNLARHAVIMENLGNRDLQELGIFATSNLL